MKDIYARTYFFQNKFIRLVSILFILLLKVMTLLAFNSQKHHFTLKTNNAFSLSLETDEYINGIVERLSEDISNLADCDRANAAEFCKKSDSNVEFEVDLDVMAYNEEDRTSCHSLMLISYSNDYIPRLCFELKDAHWFGAAELQIQRWPLNHVILPTQPFVTHDIVPTNSSFGNVIERYWVNSDGVAILIDEITPLFSSFNENGDGKVCFEAKFEHPFMNIHSRRPELRMLVCKSDNIKLVNQFVNRNVLSKSVTLPDSRMFRSPIWSTWARYKVDINQEKVLQYADEINQHGFSNSQIEIDDMFSTFYGEFDFNPNKFPDPKEMVDKLKDKGFRVTVWVTPFANLDSPAFKTGTDSSYWLRDGRKQVPALLKWWQGIGAILDVSNAEAISWFVRRLEDMRRSYGIDSFKFDAGEVSYLPFSYGPLIDWENPCSYTKLYVEAVSRLGDMIEVRCGYKSQQHAVFVRMGDKESRWGYDNGLRTIIPTALTFGILGYPFILPDMIGGNGYTYGEDDDIELTETVLPDRELYIRWLQVSAYLPAMQFSFVPWQYDDEVVDIARDFVRIHEEIVTPLVLEAAKEVSITGTPIIRPLWWLEPTETSALVSDSQFLVGDSLLVAPVLEPGARSRDIYLPTGNWEDLTNGVTVKGGRWLWIYNADLHQCPTFRKL